MVNKTLTGNEKMAAQIDELYDRFKTIENLIADLSPGFEKVSKETQITIREVREKFERDETLTLIKRVGDNIPTFVNLLDTTKAIKGLLEDLAEVPEKIAKETLPIVRDLRERFERDETLELIQKTGENINTFNKLLDFLYALDESGDLNFTLEHAFAKETRCLMKGMQKCIVKAMQQFSEAPPKPGLGRLISAMMDPEVQKGLLFLTTFAKNLPECLETIKDGQREE
ncbi:MAG: DUF1641 domain-containing protein [Nitrospirota bacterium]